ncbi:OTOP3 family protein [Megaselia abdita]
MQRCPYIHEMRERLLGENNRETLQLESMERDNLIDNRHSSETNQLHADGYHTSPAHQRTPLVPRDLGEDFNLDFDDDFNLDFRRPKNAKTSLFIVTSLVYAIILIVVCIAYVISDVTTHRLPVLYYEGFFTYLYGVSILFLLYVFCFLLQESTCCNGGSKPKPPPKEKKPKKKSKKEEAAAGDTKESSGNGKNGSGKEKSGKPSPFQDSQVDPEAAITPKTIRKRKTTHNDLGQGSFFLRVGAIAFGLGSMIYVGLEIGSFFEIPFDSPCHHILIGVNPLLQMIFTFMQMYFVFMNARSSRIALHPLKLNIHRFKVIARFGLMHVVATNLCVWIRTLVKESLHEITRYHQNRGPDPEDSVILESIRKHTLRHASHVLGTHAGPNSEFEVLEGLPRQNTNILSKIMNGVSSMFSSTEITSTLPPTTTTTSAPWLTSTVSRKLKKFITSTTMTTPSTTMSTTTTTTELPTSVFSTTTQEPRTTTPVTSTVAAILSTLGLSSSTESTQSAVPSTSASEDGFMMNNLFSGMENNFQTFSGISHPDSNAIMFENLESLDNIYPAALSSNIATLNSTACGRVDIMGTIVYDSAPYLYPFIIEYSLIGAVVLYVMWKHIGRYPKHLNDEDLEHRLEVMLSRRAVAMAQQARSGRVDCVGSSKGLFFGLLLLVGALICLILFFVLVRHPQFSLLAIYLADVSHIAVMGFMVLAIIIGFIRVRTLKFRCEEQSNLNDILLRISAFGLFTYSTFSVIAGSLKVMESEPNLLVTVTGSVAVFQVVLQLLFIADVSRRRVHLPEHDRTKPGRQIVTFLLICNLAIFAIYTFEAQKVFANPVQLDFYGYVPWSIIQRITLPLCIFHRFHSAVTLAEIWKTTYKPRLD